VIFALLAIATIIDGWARLSGFWLHKIVLVAFGISLLSAAIFQSAPIVPGAAFSGLEDDLHSKFSTATGFSFTFFAISASFIESTRKRKIIAVGIGILAMILSVLIFNFADLAGVWQRMIFMSAFLWLIYFLYPRPRTF